MVTKKKKITRVILKDEEKKTIIIRYNEKKIRSRTICKAITKWDCS